MAVLVTDSGDSLKEGNKTLTLASERKKIPLSAALITVWFQVNEPRQGQKSDFYWKTSHRRRGVHADHLCGGKLNKSGAASCAAAYLVLLWKCSSIRPTVKPKIGKGTAISGLAMKTLSRFNSEALKKSFLHRLYDVGGVQTDKRMMSAAHPHLRNKRSSAWDGQKQTSVSSMIWFCRPSSPGDPCTSSLWGWWRGRCRCCGPRTPRGSAGQIPVFGWADSASSAGPVKRGRGFLTCV